MKRDWLLYLVIFSLALNVGTVGALAYFKWQERQAQEKAEQPPGPATGPRAGRGEPALPFRELMDKLNLEADQRQTMWRLMTEQSRQVMALRRSLAERRAALFALMKQPELPPWEKVQTSIREINELQVRLEEEMARHLLEVQKHLRPEQRQILLSHLEQRLSHFWGGRGPSPHMMGPRRGFGPPQTGPQPPLGNTSN
jgi:Spy/CpxP family protein refolding chaperone